MLKKGLITITLAVFFWLCCCAPKTHSSAHEVNVSSPARTASSDLTAGRSGSQLDFTLVNLSGVPLNAIYVSPAASSGWEENVIAGTKLADGDGVKIRFNVDERTTSWDLRVVGVNGRYAEWKGLDLSDIATVKLRVRMGTQPVAMIEAE